KRFVSLMSLVPLISPPFLVSLAFILLLGRNGVVTRGLGLDWSIYGFTGIVASQVFTFLPQAYILLANVLGNIDASLEEAAENLGAGMLTTLGRVTLALARPGLASAALIVFILCMTDFGNPILIGGRYNVLATEIYAQVIGMNDFPAAARRARDRGAEPAAGGVARHRDRGRLHPGLQRAAPPADGHRVDPRHVGGLLEVPGGRAGRHQHPQANRSRHRRGRGLSWRR